MPSPFPPSVPTDSHTDYARPYDDFRAFLHFPLPTTSDHHDPPPPHSLINGDDDRDEEDSVGVRRRSGDDDDDRVREKNENRGVKRARAAADAVDGNECLDFDLNLPFVYLGVGESINGFLDESRGKEVVHVDSDAGGDGDGDVDVLNEGEFYANDEENAIETDMAAELNLRMIDVGSLCEGSRSSSSSSGSSQKRYSREEKGKGKLDHNWLSITVENHRVAFSGRDGNEEFGVLNEHSEGVRVVSDAGVNVFNEGDFCQNGEENAIQTDMAAELEVWMVDVGLLCDGSGSGQKRYSREEKSKGKLDDNWLSIAIENHRVAYSQRDETNVFGGRDIHMRNDVEWNEDFGVLNEHSENCFVTDVNGIHNRDPEELFIGKATTASLLENPTMHSERPAGGIDNNTLFNARMQANRRRVERRRNKEIAKDYANNLANLKQSSEAESPRQKIQEASGPFSSAMQKILDQKQGKPWLWTQQRSFSIEWTPSRTQGTKLMIANIPSLLDLSLNVLAKNFKSIVSLEPLPDALRRRISQAACDHRKMDTHLLEKLVTESSTEVYVKDCSWMTEAEFQHIFRVLDTKHLMVLQLDLCGQALTEYTLGTTLAQSKNGLPALANLSLKSACRLTDNGLISILELAPSLQSINLSQCSLLTTYGISKLASCPESMLKELYIDDCTDINALDLLPALVKLKHLEVLSVSGINTVSDEFVCQFICSSDSKLREIGLANCQKLTDSSFKAIGEAYPGLCALDISYLDQLTDATLEYIANGCRFIQKLKCCRNSFSDEAIASFLEVSGQSLKELSLNHISKVDSYTALSLAKHSRSLLILDLSWCRKLTDAAAGLVVDSCLSLRLLKLFGCTQLTEVFLNGHLNPNVEIIGLNNMPVLKQLGAVDSHPGPLRYSPLIT